ncbi:MAG: hypothetical protein AAF685_16510 [Cyanobacteria bacterium P01_C01_bin.89]
MAVKCNITAKELAKALDIREEKLEEICEFFDSDPDDDWELTEGLHFKWGAYQARIFSYEGAVEICTYLEENQQERSFLMNFKRWFLQKDKQLKGLMISKRVEDIVAEPGQIIFEGGRAFLHPRSCRHIIGLGRRQDILNRTFVELVRNENTEIEPPRKGHDFHVAETNERYFSGSGLASIGKQLSSRFTQRHRRAWAEVVSIYAPKAIGYVEKREYERDKRIAKAMDKVRKSARGRCQVTNRKKSIHKFSLEVHHLYDRKSYPEVADVEANLIAIAADVHIEFHKWLGGTNKGCTLEDFEAFLEYFYSSLFDDISEDNNYEWMMKVKGKLADSKKSLSGYLK